MEIHALRPGDSSPTVIANNVLNDAHSLKALYCVGILKETGQLIFWTSGNLGDLAFASLGLTDLAHKILNDQVTPDGPSSA